MVSASSYGKGPAGPRRVDTASRVDLRSSAARFFGGCSRRTPRHQRKTALSTFPPVPVKPISSRAAKGMDGPSAKAGAGELRLARLPNGISVPRAYRCHQPHLEGKPSMGKSIRNLTSCHAGRARSGEERDSGSRRRCDGRATAVVRAQAHARPVVPFFFAKPQRRAWWRWVCAPRRNHWGRALIELGHEAEAHLPKGAFEALRAV